MINKLPSKEVSQQAKTKSAESTTILTSNDGQALFPAEMAAPENRQSRSWKQNLDLQQLRMLKEFERVKQKPDHINDTSFTTKAKDDTDMVWLTLPHSIPSSYIAIHHPISYLLIFNRDLSACVT